MRDGDDHVLALDQVLVVDVGFPIDDLGPARRREGVAHFDEFVLDDRHDPRARAQDLEIVRDLAGELLQLVADLVAAERRKALQAQVENGAGLRLREAIGAVLVDLVARIVDERDQRRDVVRRPIAAHQRLARRVRIRRRADEADDLVDIGDRDRKAAQHVGALARLVEQELGAAGDDLLAEIDEGPDQVLQRQQFRPAAVQRHHVGAEARLQRRIAVELVQHHVRHRVALDLDDDAHALAVGFVAQVRDALDLLLAHEVGDLLDERRLVHLIGNLGEDDRLALLAELLDIASCARMMIEPRPVV